MVKIPNVWNNSICTSLLMHSIIRLLCTECLCSPQIHTLKSYPQCDGIRRQGLWKVVKIRWTHEGKVFMNGISAFRRITTCFLPLSALHHMWIQWNVRLLQARRHPPQKLSILTFWFYNGLLPRRGDRAEIQISDSLILESAASLMLPFSLKHTCKII